MHDPLDPLLADGVIDDVLGRLKSGKEADIYLVRYGGGVVAAKVYKDRQQRSFKHNADYKEGRAVRNSRTRRAIESRSRFGQTATEDAWKSTESDALHQLYAGGVRVPEPVMFYEGILLMHLVTDAEGRPAPRLIDMEIPAATARALYEDLRSQIVRMLCCEVIHGDLSAYNILAASEGPTIIDFPQIVSAAHNSRSEFFFQRDCQNVLRFLAGSDRSLLAFSGDARKIWSAYTRRHLTPDFVPSPPKPGEERQERQGRQEGRPPRTRPGFGGDPRSSGGPRAGSGGPPRDGGGHGDTRGGGQPRTGRDHAHAHARSRGGSPRRDAPSAPRGPSRTGQDARAPGARPADRPPRAGAPRIPGTPRAGGAPRPGGSQRPPGTPRPPGGPRPSGGPGNGGGPRPAGGPRRRRRKRRG